MAYTGEAVLRKLVWAADRVNARGGVWPPSDSQPLVIAPCNSEGQNKEALNAQRAPNDDGTAFITLGSFSAVAALLQDMPNKHSEREPSRRGPS